LTIIADGHAATAALGLGGNIGDPAAAMAQALRTLNERADCTVLSVSKLYSTPPWGKLDQADFFNCCALVQTRLSPAALLEVCLDLERLMKRVRLERWGPRTLDIDILLYNDLRIDTPSLTVPHPRMLERGFVLRPLADIADALPVAGKPVSAWLEQINASDIAIADDSADWWQSR
jgi:2-amino-4-hydroxy-6-hydroxymethyldihydropteridine diphosphokinase